MQESKLIQVYGAERIGKTTFCNNFVKENPKYTNIHFGIPNDNEENSLSNYNLPGNKNFIITDRGPLEANIFRPIGIFEIHDLLINYILDFQSVEFYVIESTFKECEKHHIEEIDNLYPHVKDWKKQSLLQDRRIKHFKYYQQIYENIYNLSNIFNGIYYWKNKIKINYEKRIEK